MMRMKSYLFICIALGIALLMTGCKAMDGIIIGLLEFKETPISKLTDKEVPAAIMTTGDGKAVFWRNGVRGIYAVHPVQEGASLKVKSVYGDSAKIVVKVTETSEPAGNQKPVKAAASLQSFKQGTSAVAILLPQVPESDQRRIIIQYDPLDAMMSGKELKTIEAKCRPAIAYSAIRYHFEPMDAKNTAILYVDKGPTPLGDKVFAMNLKTGDPVMVTYVVQEDNTKPSEVVEVVRKPTVGMPGGPQ